jgi:hypothetical protein
MPAITPLRAAATTLALATAVLAAHDAPRRGQGPAGAPAVQTPASQTAKSDTPPPEYGFATKAGVLIFHVKPASANDFEGVMSKLQTIVTATKDATLQQQAAGWKVYRGDADPASGDLVYVWVLDPAVPNTRYDPIAILKKESPADVQPLFDRLQADVVKVEQMGLTLVASMGRDR